MIKLIFLVAVIYSIWKYGNESGIFNRKEHNRLKILIKEKFDKDFNGEVTSFDIITYAFTLDGVIAVAMYEDVFIQALCVKTIPMSHKKIKEISFQINQFIYRSTKVYPRKLRIDVNGRIKLAEKRTRFISIEEQASSLGIH